MLIATQISAQESPPTGAAPNPLVQFFPFILVFFIFYFLVIRPQKKKLEEEKKLLGSLEKGREVFTKSGLLGTICGLSEKVVTLQVEGAKLKVLRSQIGGLAKDLTLSKTEKKS